MPRKKLGEILLEQGLIDEEDLDEGLRYKEESGYRLGTALVALRIIAEWQLTEALGKALEVEVIDLGTLRPSKAALRRIPVRLAERFDLIPIKITGRGKNSKLLVAMSDPLNRPLIKRMEDMADCQVEPVLASLSAIQRAIRRHYHGGKRGKVLDHAEKMKGNRNSLKKKDNKTREGTRQIALSHLQRELERMEQAEESLKKNVPMIETDQGKGQAMELKFRALLHAMIKKGLITGSDYAQALNHVLEVDQNKS